MTPIDPKILGKIKKCLALAGSSNPNEAATAWRQAQALMTKYGVNEHAITMADVGETGTPSRTMARDKPAAWEYRLISLVGKAFGCRVFLSRRTYVRGHGPCNDGEYRFLGLKHQAELAAYTASVLVRKCHRDRARWITECASEAPRAAKSRMGDLYAEGWILAVSKTITDFANPPGVEEAMERHMQEAGVQKSDDLCSRDRLKGGGRLLNPGDVLAAQMGMHDGKGQQLHRPMGKDDDRATLAFSG